MVPTLTSTYTGFKNNDSPNDIADKDLFTTGTSASIPGLYDIDFAGHPTSLNYDITLVPGSLEIKSQDNNHKVPQQPSLVPDSSIPKVKTPITLEKTGGDDHGWGIDHNSSKASMPMYFVTARGKTNVGAYDVSENQTGVKLHPTMNVVSEPQDDVTEHRSYTVQYSQNNITGTFNVVFDGSIVKVTPLDAKAKQMVMTNSSTRYVSLFKGALNTTLNNMGVVLDSIRAVYLINK